MWRVESGDRLAAQSAPLPAGPGPHQCKATVAFFAARHIPTSRTSVTGTQSAAWRCVDNAEVSRHTMVAQAAVLPTSCALPCHIIPAAVRHKFGTYCSGYAAPRLFPVACILCHTLRPHGRITAVPVQPVSAWMFEAALLATSLSWQSKSTPDFMRMLVPPPHQLTIAITL